MELLSVLDAILGSSGWTSGIFFNKKRYVITITGASLEEALVREIAGAVSANTTLWLSPGKAVQLHITDDVLRTLQLEEVLSRCIASAPMDWILQPLPLTRKKLLICDMDSTIIQQECIDELADFVGKKAHVAAITERAMNGELVFEDALRERVALLKDLPESVLQECFDKKITLMPGAKELVAAFKQQGGKAVLVSGGFTFFTSRVATLAGFDENYANILELENGKLTGKVREPILGKEAKLEQLEQQCKLLGIGHENVIAIGDGANDLPMLRAAGLGIAYHAKPVVAASVKSRINHGDLSVIIHLL